MAAAIDHRRPGIFQIGEVIVDEETVQVRGWGLCLCFAQCRCHFHPASGSLYVFEDDDRGLLGLQSFAPGGCNCCAPWSTEELHDVLATLYALQAA